MFSLFLLSVLLLEKCSVSLFFPFRVHLSVPLTILQLLSRVFASAQLGFEYSLSSRCEKRMFHWKILSLSLVLAER